MPGDAAVAIPSGLTIAWRVAAALGVLITFTLTRAAYGFVASARTWSDWGAAFPQFVGDVDPAAELEAAVAPHLGFAALHIVFVLVLTALTTSAITRARWDRRSASAGGGSRGGGGE